MSFGLFYVKDTVSVRTVRSRSRLAMAVRLGRRLAVMVWLRRRLTVVMWRGLGMVMPGRRRCMMMVMPRRRRCMMMVMMVVVIIPVIVNQGIKYELTGGKEQRTRCDERDC